MLKILVLGGCGIQGKAAVFDLAGSPGVDEIICLSVNDAFVMNEWKDDLGITNITFLPDGNGAFTEGMGMLVKKQYWLVLVKVL